MEKLPKKINCGSAQAVGETVGKNPLSIIVLVTVF